MKTLKTLLLLVFVLCSIKEVAAQQQYSLPVKTYIYDIPGDHFLTHFIKGNKAYLQERNVAGNVIWEDSLNNNNEILAIDSVLIQRFGESNNFCVFLVRHVPGPNGADSLSINYSLFSTNTHQFESFKSFTIRSAVIKTCFINESLIYLFSDISAGQRTRKHQVLSINKNMEMLEVAAANDVITKPVSDIFSYFFVPNSSGIKEVYHNYGDMYIKNYDEQFQALGGVDSSVSVDNYDFSIPVFIKPVGADSLFVAYFSYEFQENKNAWVFTWNDSRLRELSSYHNVFSSTDMEQLYLNNNFVSIDASQIYVSGMTGASPGPQQGHVYIYNYQFEPVCHFLYDYQYGDLTTLTTLNERPYLKRVRGNQTEYLLIDNCSFPASVAENTNQRALDGMTIFPNPSNGQFIFKTTTNVAGKTATVFSVLGHEIAKINLSQSFENSLNLAATPGVYLLKVEDNPTLVTKFVVH